MARGKPHSPEIKAAVVAALLSGQGADRIAEDFAIPKATVLAWRRSVRAENIVDEPKKRDELADLVIAYVRENLTTLAAQSAFARDREWLKVQPASEVAVLHGVIADKTLRILAALEPEPEPEPAQP